jgi:alpha-galactosidase
VGVDFINYDYAFTTAWDWGDNARNASIAVNGAKGKRWAFPLSDGNWGESGRLVVEVEGFREGSGNVLFFGGFGAGPAPELVGVEVLE